MVFHANAKLGLSGRLALVGAIEQGLSLKAAAAAFSVSPATAHRWWHRWLEGGRCREALADRSSRPRRSRRQLSVLEEQPILEARRQAGYGPGRLAGIVRRARSTIWKVLYRHGLSRLPRPQQQPPRRYEWSRPGALLHVDVKKLAPFQRPAHRVTGDRQRRSRRVGYDYLHVVADDNSRYAYVELHPREDTDTAARVLERALGHLAELGIDQSEAVMTDNALAYTRGERFQAVLAANHLRHITTQPYAPLERKSRALHPDAAKRMGLHPPLAQLQQPRPRPGKLPPLLQPAPPARLTRRRAADQPHSQRLWVLHLERNRGFEYALLAQLQARLRCSSRSGHLT